jgi:hypothetical protein
MAVIALHAQCLASCYAMHDVPRSSTSTSPCHSHGSDKAPDSNHAPDHDNACGVGPVTPSKISAMPGGLQASLPLLELPSILEKSSSPLSLAGDAPPPLPGEPALRLNLRI